MPVLENARHEKFVQCLISGMSQRKAYRVSFTQSVRWKDNTVDVKASQLFALDKVRIRYTELQEEAQDAAIMSYKERMIKLSEIATDDEFPNEQMKAIDILNKMDGVYTNKVEMSGSIDVPLKNKEEAARQWIESLIEDG